MKSISKILLLSAVGLCVESGNLAYASFEAASFHLKSGIPTLHTHHTYIRHTQEILSLSSHLFDKGTDKGVKIASVCFITDAGNCDGHKLNNNDDYTNPEDLCKQGGYSDTPCPEGSYPSDFCPYDSSYHAGCKCDAAYNQRCDGYDEKGVGVACGGKYKDCCNFCSDYKYSSIPAGYISNGECQSCDGKKYKIRCDPQKYVSASSCGIQGGSGSLCTDDYGTYYTKCDCPNNYEWNSAQKKCVCATSFKYSCLGTGYAGGEGNSCNNKYSKCKCSSGFTWNASQGACVCTGIDFCSLNQDCSTLGYAQQSCSNAAITIKCPFNTNYVSCFY